MSDGGPTVELGAKGSDGVNRASEQRESNINVHPGQVVHVKCRRNYCEPNRIAKEVASKHVKVEEERTGLRSLQPPFDFRKHCIFCGQPAKYDGKRRGFDVIPVRTKEFQDSVTQICIQRNDTWSQIVSGRLASINDLPAADAVLP